MAIPTGAQFGRIDEFQPSKETFTEYEERLNFFFEANDVVKDSKKRAIFLTVVGPTQFRLLKDLSQPRSVSELPFSDLCRLLRNHHEPAPPKFLQRAKFEARSRRADESVQSFIADLRKLAEHCQFGDQLEERLCEKFARGINCEEVQRKLLLKPDIKLSDAVDTAVATIQVSKATKFLNKEPADQNVGAYSAEPLHYSSKTRHRGKQQQPPNPKHARQQQHCYRCGGPHSPHACKFKDATCYKCAKTGHISKVCRSTKSNKPKQHSNHLLAQEQSREDMPLFAMQSNKNSSAISVILGVQSSTGEKNIEFQLDTGASLSVISKEDFDRNIRLPIRQSKNRLLTYTGETVHVYGEALLSVSYEDQRVKLPILVIKGEGPPLIGRNWLNSLKLNWRNLFSLNTPVNSLVTQYNEVFGPDGGGVKDLEVKIHVSNNDCPVFMKARHPPYILKEGIEKELIRLEEEDIIEKVEFSEWATPIVPVVKKDKSIRICGDFKTTVNKAIHQDTHPIPLIEDLANKLAGGQKFSTLDFTNAYTQLRLDEESKPLTTINTHKGLFMYKRLCFGISSAPSIFQRTMESIFQDIPCCVVYFDNLYITGPDDESHLKTLEKVLGICKAKGLRLRREKCEFLQEEVDFLGYRMNKDGLHPDKGKVDAINNAPRPENVSQLKSFLGLLNYYGKFIANLSSILEPLHRLLKKNQRWVWGRDQQKAFKQAKAALTSKSLLVHFNPQTPIVLICDASPYGVGAILAHRDNTGERPICFASRTLNPAERNYAQIDREALAIIFGVKRFHKYILGQSIEIITDHKPLLGLLGENKPLPEHSSARVQRWAMILSAYTYRLCYRPGHQNNADALSRLPLPETTQEEPPPFELCHLFEFLDQAPVTSVDIAIETGKDRILRRVCDFVANGWPEKVNNVELRPYFFRKHELSIDKGCLLWGARVVVPATLKEQVLSSLHDGHIGIARTKSLARSYVWWPLIDLDIERVTKSCVSCEVHKNSPPKAPLNPWVWPVRPWQRVHMDFAGPFLGKMFLIIVDSHSKWIDVKIMNKITTADTILELRDVFSTMGLPDTIVTDNGPTWTSEYFRNFLVCNGVEHILSAPYHPASNGLAERAVQVFKHAMRTNTKGSIRERVYKFLTKYRSTPHSTTGLTPAELMIGRKFKTHLDLLHPALQTKVQKQQKMQASQHDKTSRSRDIGVSDDVLVRNYSKTGGKWIPGVIKAQTGPVSYKVSTPTHGVLKRHVDQVRETYCDPYQNQSQTKGDGENDVQCSNVTELQNDVQCSNVTELQNDVQCSNVTELQNDVQCSANEDDMSCVDVQVQNGKPNNRPGSSTVINGPNLSPPKNMSSSQSVPNPQSAIGIRRSTRTRKAPDRFSPSS